MPRRGRSRSRIKKQRSRKSKRKPWFSEEEPLFNITHPRSLLFATLILPYILGLGYVWLTTKEEQQERRLMTQQEIDDIKKKYGDRVEFR